jgi:hypothetical protein
MRHAVFKTVAPEDKGYFARVARKMLAGRVSCADQMDVLPMDNVCLVAGSSTGQYA